MEFIKINENVLEAVSFECSRFEKHLIKSQNVKYLPMCPLKGWNGPLGQSVKNWSMLRAAENSHEIFEFLFSLPFHVLEDDNVFLQRAKNSRFLRI